MSAPKKTPLKPTLLGGEWGKIKTIVVGNPTGAHFPDEVPQLLRATLPSGPTLETILKGPGNPFPEDMVKKACQEVESLMRRFESLGIQVLQPSFSKNFFESPIVTPHFQTKSGLYAAMPRDNMLFLPPDILVMAPMAFRSRYRENSAYANVVEELKKQGINVIYAPQPKLTDLTYKEDWQDIDDGVFRSVIRNLEPLFDAADFMRFGNHIIAQLSHVTNVKGIEWVRSIMPPQYRLHVIDFNDAHPMHVDATIMPLFPGKALVHPERVPVALRKVLNQVLFKDWEMVQIPGLAQIKRQAPLYFTSAWIKMNIVVGDGWATIEEADHDMAKLMKQHEIEPIMQPLQNFQALGGSFHCCTADLRLAKDIQPDGITQGNDLYIHFNHETKSYEVRSLEELLHPPMPQKERKTGS